MSNPVHKIILKSTFLCLCLGISSCSQRNRTLNSFNQQPLGVSQLNTQSRPTDSVDISRYAFPLKSGQFIEYSGTGLNQGVKVSLTIEKVTQAEVFTKMFMSGRGSAVSYPQVFKNDSQLLENWIKDFNKHFKIMYSSIKYPSFFRSCTENNCATQINSPVGLIQATKVRLTNIVAETSNQALSNRDGHTIIDPGDDTLIPVDPPNETYIDISKPFSLDLKFSQNVGLISLNIPELNTGYTLTSFK